MAKLAFLGTGLIGAGLAEGAAKRGESVVVWNRTRSKAEALQGVKVAGSVAEAVRGADRVHVALPDDKVVEEVLAQAGDALRGPVVVDHTTASPAGTKLRAERLEGQGVAYLHAPVFMSPQMCRDAKGMMLVSGPRAAFDRAESGLKMMTGTVEFLGERRDLAAAYKLFGNAMILTVTAGFADVLAMAKTLGIPPNDAFSLFTKFNPAGSLAYRGAAMARGDFSPSFELSMARKDARLMIEAAAAAQLTVLPSIAKKMDELIARGLGADDLGALAADQVKRA